MLQHNYNIRASSLRVTGMKGAFLSLPKAENSLKTIFDVRKLKDKIRVNSIHSLLKFIPSYSAKNTINLKIQIV